MTGAASNAVNSTMSNTTSSRGNGVGSVAVNGARPLSVLHVVDSLGMGGAETWLIEVLRRWSRERIGRMDFLATSGVAALFDDEARVLGANVYYVRYGRAQLGAFAGGFRRILRRERYDAIHDHQDFASGWHFLLGNSELPPVRVTHVHNPSYQIRNNYGVTLARRTTAKVGEHLVARYATHITGTSRQVIAEYGFDAKRFDDIPKAALHCGFDPARFRGDDATRAAARDAVRREFGWPADATLVLFAGRIDQSPDPGHPQNHKNSGFAVSVAIDALAREPRLHVLFAGAPSPATPLLEQRIAGAGFDARVRFTGVRKDIARLMLASDVLLFPSRAEGLGMVAVEAQAAGLPVLASDAVPRECVVVPELVRFESLAAGPVRWADALLALAAMPRVPDANERVAGSAFAIDNSVRSLRRLYSEGALPS
jgi:glycosyltransferase involved in cell wall biosynthesis